MDNLQVSNPVDNFMASADVVAMLAALANGGAFDFSTFQFILPGTVTFGTKTLTVSNNITLVGTDGATLDIGVGGTLIQPDVGWSANLDGGDKTAEIPDGLTLATFQAPLNGVIVGCGDAFLAMGQKIKAIETALAQSLRPNL